MIAFSRGLSEEDTSAPIEASAAHGTSCEYYALSGRVCLILRHWMRPRAEAIGARLGALSGRSTTRFVEVFSLLRADIFPPFLPLFDTRRIVTSA